jgi:hypothetical protein
MKIKTVKTLLLSIMLTLLFSACPAEFFHQGDGSTSTTTNTFYPNADDYDIFGLSQTYNGSPCYVSITPKSGNSPGAVTVLYDGSTNAPAAIGSYPITFNVAAVTGWYAAFGLSAGTLVINAKPDPPSGDWNITLKGGKYQYAFEYPRIEHGETYEVIFTIEDCDSAFIESKLGGKLCFNTDLAGEDEKILSGWQLSIPNSVSQQIKNYTWIFKAGDQNSDSMPVENPATTPAGRQQYFSLTAMDSYWSDYGANTIFYVKGGFEVKLKDEFSNWVSGGEVALGNLDGVAGKGQLSQGEAAKILVMPDNGKITFTIRVTVDNAYAQPGWVIGGISSNWDFSMGNYIPFYIPEDALNGLYEFKVDIGIFLLKNILAGSDTIIINLFNGTTITKAELFRL